MAILFDNGHLSIEENKEIISISNAGSDGIVLIYTEELKEIKKALDKMLQKEYNDKGR